MDSGLEKLQHGPWMKKAEEELDVLVQNGEYPQRERKECDADSTHVEVEKARKFMLRDVQEALEMFVNEPETQKLMVSNLALREES